MAQLNGKIKFKRGTRESLASHKDDILSVGTPLVIPTAKDSIYKKNLYIGDGETKLSQLYPIVTPEVNTENYTIKENNGYLELDHKDFNVSMGDKGIHGNFCITQSIVDDRGIFKSKVIDINDYGIHFYSNILGMTEKDDTIYINPSYNDGNTQDVYIKLASLTSNSQLVQARSNFCVGKPPISKEWKQWESYFAGDVTINYSNTLNVDGNAQINTLNNRTVEDIFLPNSTKVKQAEKADRATNIFYDQSKYRGLKWDDVKGLSSQVIGWSNTDVKLGIESKVLIWKSSNVRGTTVPSSDYLAIEFEDKLLPRTIGEYEIVLFYEGGIPKESLIKIPPGKGESFHPIGGFMSIRVSLFTSPAGQPYVLCYPLGTVENWSHAKGNSGTNSTLLISDRYSIDNRKGLMFQYLELVGNEAVSSRRVSICEIYEIMRGV